MNFLGLCVSGQTIQDLLHKIKENFYPVGGKIVVMIGTNNFLKVGIPQIAKLCKKINFLL